jgi:hypothetical protein
MHGRPASTIVDLLPTVTKTIAQLTARGIDSTAFRVIEGMVFIDRATFREHRVSADSTLTAFLASIRKVPGVLRADRLSVLRSRANDRDTIGRRWRHMVPVDLPVEAVITLVPYAASGRATYAQHGSPHDYDAHVPLILFGDWFKPGKYNAMVRVVDIAPTLAHIANVPPTERVDGRVLLPALK